MPDKITSFLPPRTVAWDKIENTITLIPDKYKNIGIRIEDNVLVSENSFEVLTDLVPKEIKDIEALMET